VAAAHLYIYTHHQLTICTYVCRRHCRRTKTNSRPVTLLSSHSFRNYSRISSVFLSSFLFYDTRYVVLQMTLIREMKTERESAYKKSVITRFEVDEDAPSCRSARERAASYYLSKIAVVALARK
jgi:hypothetical protein